MEVKVNDKKEARIESVEFFITNHIITIKTHGMRSLVDTFNKLGYGTYSPITFSALTLKHKNPSTTVIVFSTGNITIMGAPNFWGAMYVIQYIKRKLDLEFINVKLTNVVVKFSIKKFKETIKINKLYEWDQSNCACNEELFPSCTYSVPNSNIKANFFTSGKIVVTGCNNNDKVKSVIEHLVDVIHRFTDGEKDLIKDDKGKKRKKNSDSDKSEPKLQKC
jgi:TATA-box binding protein (TBP) (component of TFIID and TFIIIB)